MRLYLSNTSPFNSTFHTADGQAIYKVRTSSKTFGRTTTIYRILQNDAVFDCTMRDIFGHLAQIEWKSLRSSRIRFRGRELRTRSVFKKKGWGWRGSDRVFIAPDGRQYRWKLGTASPELRILNDTQALVARFHPGGKTCFFPSRSPFLEILPAGEHIADAILVSFVYIEKLREDE
ncbi:hypothetical protein LshimejAT787_1101310 [Lyophyllum shimeji]|uniref:DUF6593 domain-containing protein n=1 Tax=Lyophyllum shimeji TaxID=47721 RepID=A0A9P3UTF9_LYOSH|nr:hypothetical protein LshimejAT787_1101310 [Lyophyllum shimeji]